MDASEEYNTGMSEAAGALSRLTGRDVRIGSPRTFVIGASGSPFTDGGQCVGVGFKVAGQCAAMFLLLTEEGARRLLGLLLGEETDAAHPLSDLEISALEEVGNILASARLNAVGVSAKMSLLPSVPNLVTGEARDLVARAVADAAKAGATLAIETPFCVGSLCSGSFFLFAGPAFLTAMNPPASL